jgi:hypothetical protein
VEVIGVSEIAKAAETFSIRCWDSLQELIYKLILRLVGSRDIFVDR